MTWELQFSYADVDIKSISFIDSLNGWMSTEGRKLHRTYDGGNTWNFIGELSVDWIKSICFVDSLNGWVNATDDEWRPTWMLLKTEDGGNNWIEKYCYPHWWGGSGRRVNFVNNWIGCGFGACGFVRTDDGGETWNPLYFDVNDAVFIDSLNGWAIKEDKKIVHTSNGGPIWEQQYQCNKVLNRIVFTDTLHGCVIGENGFILQTVDGGQHWVVMQSGTTEDLIDFSFIDENHGWIVGEKGTVLHNSNASVGIKELTSSESHIVKLNAYPNPFSTKTNLSYTLSKAASVSINIYDNRGQLVYEMNDEQSKGKQQIALNTHEWPAGIYFIVLKTNESMQTTKIIKL